MSLAPRLDALLHALLCLALLVFTATAQANPARKQALQEAFDLYAAGKFGEAQQHFEALAAKGVAAAHHNLAVMLLRGEVAAGPAGAPTALAHMRQAARAGFVTAQFGLAQMYDQGTGVRKDLHRALHWFRRAGQAGSVDAQIAVGTAYYLGRGVPRDPRRAAAWYGRAATAGDVGAQYLVASMYASGDGVERDDRVAAYWYRAAAANGDAAAVAQLQALASREQLSPPTKPSRR